MSRFPLLDPDNHDVTSEPDDAYNCIAWAAGQTDRRWWPIHDSDWYWPDAIVGAETTFVFVDAFRALGYERCADPGLDASLEKVAFFAKDGLVTHAARQLEDGWWTSKMGFSNDLRHRLKALEGDEYGTVACVVARPRSSSQRQ